MARSTAAPSTQWQPAPLDQGTRNAVVQRSKPKSEMRRYLEDPIDFSWDEDGRTEASFDFNDVLPLDHISRLDGKKKMKEILQDKKADSMDTARREVTNMRGNRYPHIVALLGTYLQRDRLHIIMFPAASCDLGDLMEDISEFYIRCQPNRRSSVADAQRRPSSIPRITVNADTTSPSPQTFHKELVDLVGYFVCLCQALAYLHRLNIRHKDVKPENILIDEFGYPLLADFGISKVFEPHTSHVTSDEKMRTARYQSPEKHRGLQRDDADDIFSLGCVFLEMASIILGEDWKSCKDHFSHIINMTGTEDSFCTNLAKLEPWLEQLRTAQNLPQGVTLEDKKAITVALGTITDMMSQDPRARPSSSGLYEKFDFPGQPKCRDCHPDVTDELGKLPRDQKSSTAEVTNSSRRNSSSTRQILESPATVTESDPLERTVRLLQETTINTYLELSQAKNSVDELRQVIKAAVLVKEHSSTPLLGTQDPYILQSLADAKNHILDIDDNEEMPYRHSSTEIQFSQMKFEDVDLQMTSLVPRLRTPSTYIGGLSSSARTWIEWKSYRLDFDVDSQGNPAQFPVAAALDRIRELTALLMYSTIAQFRVPRCLGYFDNRGDASDSEQSSRFGIVFEHPDQKSAGPVMAPLSLFEAISSHPCPSLTVRIAMAHKIAKSLLYLHAVRWLHKGLRSDSIIFFGGVNRTLSFDEPYLTGFEYARPDVQGAHSTAISQDPLAELYVYPNYQGENAVGTYRKTFDIYSLGMVLLEIVSWKHLQDVMEITELDPSAAMGVRQTMLAGQTTQGNVIAKVREQFGDKVHEAIRSCITGPSAFGLTDEANELEGSVGVALQQAFKRLVVDNLEQIVV